MANIKEYIIYPEQSLIVEYYNGGFPIEELIAFKDLISRDSNYSPNFNIIHDIRKAKFLFQFGQISQYVDFLSSDKKYVGNRKSIVLTTSPEQVIIGLGFDMKKGDLPIDVKVASKLETSLLFFNNPLALKIPIESWINSIKQSAG